MQSTTTVNWCMTEEAGDNKVRIKRLSKDIEPSPIKVTKQQGGTFSSFVSSLGWLGFSSDRNLLSKKGVHSTNSVPEVVATVKKIADSNDSDNALIAALEVVLDICQQPQPEKLKESLGKSSLLNTIGDFLSSNGRSAPAIQILIKVCAVLGDIESNRVKMINLDIHKSCIRLTLERMTEKGICEWGCRFIRSFTLDPQSLLRISGIGSVDVVGDGLTRYYSSLEMVECICRAMYGLVTQNNVGNKLKLASAGVFETITDKLFPFLISSTQENVDTASANEPLITAIEWALRVVGSLSHRHEPSADKLIDMNIHKSIFTLYGLLGSTSKKFATSYLTCLAQVTQNNNRAQAAFMEVGAAASVLHIMVQFTEASEPSVVQESFRALRNFCHDNDEVQEQFAELQASTKVILCIQTLGKVSEEVTQWGWYAVTSLALYPKNLPLLAKAGACSAAVEALVSYQECEEVCTWVCMGTAALINDDYCCELLMREGIFKILSTVISTHGVSSDSIAQDGCCVLGKVYLVGLHRIAEQLTQPSEGQALSAALAASVAKTGFVDAILRVLSAHAKAEAVLEQACFACYAFASDHESCSTALITGGVCKLLPRILTAFASTNLSISLWSIRAHYEFIVVSESNSILCGTNGACAAIVTAVNSCMQEREIALWGLKTIEAMAKAIANIPKFLAANVEATLAAALARYGGDDEVNEHAYLCIANLSAAPEAQKKLGSGGVCEVTILSLRKYRHRPSSVCAGSAALCALSTGNVENNTRLGANSCSTLEWCLGTMKAFAQQEDVLISMCTLLSVLAEGANNCVKMGTMGACEEVLACLNRIPDSAGLSMAACNAIGSMCASAAFNQQRLGSAGACETIVKTLQEFSDSVLISRWACRAIYRLADGNPLHKNIFTENHACALLVQSFCKHADSAEVSEQACLGLSVLSDGSASNAAIMVHEGICACLVTASMKHGRKPDVVVAICRLVVALSPTSNEELAQAGICEAVLTSFKELVKQSDAVAAWSCRAIAALAVLPKNQAVLAAYKCCEELTAALTYYVGNESIFTKVLLGSGSVDTGSAEVVQWACNATSQMGYNKEENVTRFGNLGMCETVVRAMLRFPDVEEVAVAGCRVICMLLKDHAINIVRLGNAGACHVLVEALIVHPGSELVAGSACRAIKFLAHNKEINIPKLTSAGACETVPVAIQAHQTSTAVASAGCGALAALACNMENVKRMGYSGACEALVFSLKNHWQNDRLVERACRAMGRLALAPGNAAWFGPAGACEAVINAQNRHLENEYIAAAAFGAMGNLAMDENNRNRLAQAGCCEAVVSAMQRHSIVEDVVRMCARCIARLATTEQNRDSLRAAGVCGIMASSMDQHLANGQVILQLCKTTSVLAAHDESIQHALGDMQCCRKLVNIMNQHRDVDLIVIESCYALLALSERAEANQLQCQSAEIVTVLIAVIELYLSSETFAVAVSQLIYGIIDNNGETLVYLLDNGIPGHLLRLLARHSKSLEIVHPCVAAFNLFLHCTDMFHPQMIQSGLLEQLGGILSRFADTTTGTGPHAVAHTASCLICLCTSNKVQQLMLNANIHKGAITSLQRQGELETLMLLCALLKRMSEDFDEAKLRIGQAGGCKALVNLVDKNVQLLLNLVEKQSRSKLMTRQLRKSIMAMGSGMSTMASAATAAVSLISKLPVTTTTARKSSPVSTAGESEVTDDAPSLSVSTERVAEHGDSDDMKTVPLDDVSHGLEVTTPSSTSTAVEPYVPKRKSVTFTVDSVEETPQSMREELLLVEACCQALMTLCKNCKENQTKCAATELKECLRTLLERILIEPITLPLAELCAELQSLIFSA